MEKFYTFSKNLELYSYGNDYSIIQENLDLYKIDIDSKYRTWNNSFLDIRFIFQSYGINTSNYTSGTVYKHFNLKPKQEIKIHDAEWDTYSLFLTLVYILEK